MYDAKRFGGNNVQFFDRYENCVGSFTIGAAHYVMPCKKSVSLFWSYKLVIDGQISGVEALIR